MGICYGKNVSSVQEEKSRLGRTSSAGYTGPNPNPNPNPTNSGADYTLLASGTSNSKPNSNANRAPPSLPPKSPWRAAISPYNNTWTSPFRASPFRASPFRTSSSSSTANSPANNSSSSNGGHSTPSRFFKRPFPPPSPAKHIQAALAKRLGWAKGDPIPEGQELDKPLDKSFGYSKSFSAKYELGEEIGRGHFGHTCRALIKKGEFKGLSVAVKVISKAKMTTAISIEDVRREVKILKALSGHPNLVKFYDACEDAANVYIVMELCEGGELLDRILSRGGKYSEEDAKVVAVQILSIVSFCHLQGVVHRDLKPENFLFATKEENSQLKAIDFGLSDFVRPDERLNDIVGSAYYVAPEVLHRAYSMEADVWSVGVITYILLCGSRPFWARTESGIFRSVLKTAPSFDEEPWPSISAEAKDFVRRLLNKDRHKRMTAAQALAHPWIRGQQDIPLDIMIYKLVKFYIRSTSVRRAALKALAKTLSEDDLLYLRAQFLHLQPNKNGRVTLENFKAALNKLGTDALKESRMFDMIAAMDTRPFKMDFEEFCAAAMSVAQLEGREASWERQAREAYEIFDKDGNRVVVVEDLAKELGIPPSVPTHVVLHDWIRHNDGKISFAGFTYLVRGMPPRTNAPKAHHHHHHHQQQHQQHQQHQHHNAK